MSNILRLGLRACLTKSHQPSKFLSKPTLIRKHSSPAYSRMLWPMCSASRANGDFMKPKPASELCECGCRGFSNTGGEKELVEFLQGEIAEEKKAQKMRSLPADLDGFKITSDEAELTFEKKSDSETVTVSMNVNHSVDTDEVGDDSEEMKAKPSFEVEIAKNNKILNFACSYLPYEEGGTTEAGDIFEITEVTYFEGEWKDKTYSVAADLLDENLYDIFMAILNEKGITKKFVEKVSEIATYHEHSQYINLLENMRKFVSAN